METLSKEQIIKQAKIIEDYQGNESEILGAEKGGKFHGFIAGAEWAIENLEAEKKELLEALDNLTEYGSTGEDAVEMKREIESLIQKYK